MSENISKVLEGLYGKNSTQYGYVHTDEGVNEDEWKTMHGAHILIDTDGDIVAGGPERLRKKKVDKKEVKDIKKNADAKSEKEAEDKKSDSAEEQKPKKERKSYAALPKSYQKKFRDAKLDPKLFVNPTEKNKKEGFSTADRTLFSTDSGRSYDFNSVAMPVKGSSWNKWGDKGCVDILKETYGDKSASIFGVKSFDEISDIKKLASALGTAVRNGLDMKPYKENFDKEFDSRKEKQKEHNHKEYEKKKAEKEERIERVKVSRQKAIDSIDTNKRIRDKKGTKEAVNKALKFMKDYGDEYGTSKITNPNDGPGMFNFGSKKDNYRIFMGDYVGEIQKKSGLYGKEFRNFCYDLGINPKFMPSSH